MQVRSILIATLVSARVIISCASYAKIAGYAPGSKVTSHNAIDLDQKAMENALDQSTVDYANAKRIYQEGGNSKPYAEFSVPALTVALKKGDKVVGKTSTKTGSIYSNYAVGATTIKVAYSTSDTQTTYVGCKGGALPAAPAGTTATAMTPYILTTDCLQNEVLTVTTGGSTVEITPTGAPVNKAGRTLKGFSTKAEGTMHKKGPNGGCAGASDRSTDGCPYVDFSQYYGYYGNFDYADKMVLAAFDAAPTGFTNAAGNMDFSSTAGNVKDVRIQIIKKGTAYMNAYMYAIREFEDAIDDCKAGCKNGQSGTEAGKDCNSLSAAAVHAWDEGVAFYTGSLEGADPGGSSSGKMSYRLAEKRCTNFKTCIKDGKQSTSGTSQVNTEMFKQLDIGQKLLLQGKCDEAKPVVRKIVALMTVPLIQGTLRYAYKVDKLNGGAKEKAEGAIFAAAIVPRVASYSSSDANTIMTNMKIGASKTSFADVKKAFENNYKSMSITCSHVGGLWFSAEKKYYDGADPCKDPAPAPSSSSAGTASNAPRTAMLSVGNVIALLFACFCFLHQ